MKFGQTKRMSLVESVAGTVIGFTVAVIANIIVLPWFGLTPSLSDNFLIAGVFTVISLVRGYLVRRLFNWIHCREIVSEIEINRRMQIIGDLVLKKVVESKT